MDTLGFQRKFKIVPEILMHSLLTTLNDGQATPLDFLSLDYLWKPESSLEEMDYPFSFVCQTGIHYQDGIITLIGDLW